MDIKKERLKEIKVYRGTISTRLRYMHPKVDSKLIKYLKCRLREKEKRGIGGILNKEVK